jgi:pantetheine-phosphate adenylyltransferase
MRKAVLAGSFDPITLGHMDILTRGAGLFDEVVIACGNNPAKRYLQSLETRLQVLEECTGHLKNVRVDSFSGLLVDYCQEIGAKVILRGLRAVSDFDFEFQIGLANKNLAPSIETVFLLTDSQYIFVSSSLVKEIASNGGDVSGYVPDEALRRLLQSLKDA